MKGIITVVGKDSVGIIAKICTYLSEENINILDISQTILDGYFNMIMIVDISISNKTVEFLVDDLQNIGKKINVTINLQREEIFNSMHRV